MDKSDAKCANSGQPWSGQPSAPTSCPLNTPPPIIETRIQLIINLVTMVIIFIIYICILSTLAETSILISLSIWDVLCCLWKKVTFRQLCPRVTWCPPLRYPRQSMPCLLPPELNKCTHICENYFWPLVIQSDFCKSKSFPPPNLKLYEITKLPDNVFLVFGCFLWTS